MYSLKHRNKASLVRLGRHNGGERGNYVANVGTYFVLTSFGFSLSDVVQLNRERLHSKEY